QLPLGQLGLPGGLIESHLHGLRLWHPQEPSFSVHRCAVGRPGALQVGQERLADVAEGELFGVREVGDGGVVTVARTAPGTDQGSHRLQVRVHAHIRDDTRARGWVEATRGASAEAPRTRDRLADYTAFCPATCGCGRETAT